jgi:hypothetical protein
MSLRDIAIGAARRYLPRGVRDWVVRQQRPPQPALVESRHASLRRSHRTTPVSPVFGLDRGLPIERYYIERFLHEHRHDVRGRCLEIATRSTSTSSGDGRVTAIDVLHVQEARPAPRSSPSLTSAEHVPSDTCSTASSSPKRCR